MSRTLAMPVIIRLTSPMAIEVGQPIVRTTALGAPQTRLALAFLVVERRRPITRHELADVMWPGTLPSSWGAALRGVVSKVRAALVGAGLTPDVLTSSFGSYQLHLPADTAVDIEVAASSVVAAEEALSAGDADEACEQALAGRAVAKRPFLADTDGEWVAGVRAELRALLLRALETLSDARLARHEPTLAIEAAEEVIALEPLRESAYRRLMAAHAVAGSRGEALRAYERCRKHLAQELGVSPSKETEAAYVKLLGEEPESSTLIPSGGRPAHPPLAPRLPHPPIPAGGSLVGRKRERVQVEEAWEQARAGRRKAVLLVGEAGMGKTALAIECSSGAVREGAVALYGRCDRDVWTPYQPFVEALGRYATACPADQLRALMGWGEPELARLLPELASSLQAPVPPAATEPETDRYRLFAATASFLRAIAATAPVVLVIDDLQWAGPPALMLLRHLVRALESSPVLLLLAYRPEDVQNNPTLGDALADLRRDTALVQVSLEGLDESATAALVSRLTPQEQAAGAALGRRVHEHTGGNPFFVTELLRHISDEVDADSIKTPGLDPGHGAHVPSGVADLIARRRSRLSGPANRVLEIASVVGSEFGLEVLQAVSTVDLDALLEALHDADEARLVCESQSALGHYGFRQQLIREAVYEQLGRTRRARLHGRVGEALEALGPDSSLTRVAELAHHFWMAGPLGSPRKALEYNRRAGDLALDKLAYERAVTFYERALAAGLEQAAPERRHCQLLMSLAGAHRRAGQVAAARERYLEAVKLARDLGDAEALASCALGLGGGGPGVSAWIADEMRVALLEEALAALGDEECELRTRVLAELAKALYFSDQHRRRDALVDEAVTLARRIDRPTALAEALSAARILRWGPGNTELRLALAEEIVELGEEAGDDEVGLRARLGRLADLVEMGERRTVDAEVKTVTALAAKVGQPYYRWRAQAWQATLMLVDGRLAEAEGRAAEAQSVWHAEPPPDAAGWSTVHLTVLRALQGRAGEVAGQVRYLAEAFPMVPSYRCLLALVLASGSQPIHGWTEFEAFAADGFTSPPLDSQWLFGVAALAETCSLLADTGRAEALYELLLPFAGRVAVFDAFGGGGGVLGPVAFHLGLLMNTLGRRELAEAHLEDALAASRRFNAQSWIGRVLQARVRLAAGVVA